MLSATGSLGATAEREAGSHANDDADASLPAASSTALLRVDIAHAPAPAQRAQLSAPGISRRPLPTQQEEE